MRAYLNRFNNTYFWGTKVYLFCQTSKKIARKVTFYSENTVQRGANGENGGSMSRLTPTSHLFEECYEVTTIRNLKNLDTSKVTDMSYMFYHCCSLGTIDLSGLCQLISVPYYFCKQ